MGYADPLWLATDWVVKPRMLLSSAMANETPHRPRLTPKGERTRARIVDAAARLIHERGVAGTTLRRRQGSGGGQRLAAVPLLRRQGRARAGRHRPPGRPHRRQPAKQADLGTTEGIQAWRDMVIAAAREHRRQGRLPARVARRPARRDRPPGPRPHRRRLRALVGRHRRRAAGPSGRRAPHARHHPDDLAVTLLAALQGGLLLAQVQRDTRPLGTAVDTLLALTTRSPGPSRADRRDIKTSA